MRTDPSPFYRRQRRLAYVFAALSVALLLLYLVGLGFLLETYGAPRAAAGADGLLLSWIARGAEDEDAGTRVVRLDDALEPRGPAWRLGGEAGGLLADGPELSAFFGNRLSVLRDGSTVRGAELPDQAWAVRAACAGPDGAAWIFGVHEGRLLARLRDAGAWKAPVDVSAAVAVERMTASFEGAAGPFVAWREPGATVVKTALWDGRAFAAGHSIEIGAVEHWEALSAGGRPLLLSYSREDREFRRLSIRLRRPDEAPRLLSFPDPVLLLGKKVTGLAAAAKGDRLAVAVSRWTTIHAGWVPLAGDAGAVRLVAVDAEPRWRALVGFFFPVALLFFSCSLVFLGITLLRERGGAAPEAEAGVLSRAMAFVLDQIALFPVLALAVEFLNLSPESWELGNPLLWAAWGVAAGGAFLYHFLMEGLLGWTLGKKVVGIRVAALDGAPAGLRRSLLRNLLRPFDATLPLGILVGMTALMTTRRRRRPGDFVAGTIVVDDRKGSGV